MVPGIKKEWNIKYNRIRNTEGIVKMSNFWENRKRMGQKQQDRNNGRKPVKVIQEVLRITAG